MSISEKMPGARYRKIDLHIHTPKSKCYKDKGAQPEDIVNTALATGLEAIAITDHNHIEGIDEVRRIGRRKGLYVFPGIEITAKGGHILALFDLDKPSKELGEFLQTEVGIAASKWGQEDALSKHDIDMVAEKIVSAGGLAVPAHIDSSNGFMKVIEQGQVRIRTYACKAFAALEITKPDNKEKWNKGLLRDYPKRYACIQSSDAHSLAEVGSRYTWIKMDKVGLEGFRLAFDDPEVRIRFPYELAEERFPRVNQVRASQGFLSGQVFKFNESLNCIMGGKGVGKSTVIELIRFALNQVSPIAEIDEDCMGKIAELVGPGGEIEVVVELENGEEYAVKRIFDGFNNPIQVFRAGEDVELEVSIDNLFPINAYSQGEVILIARNPIAQLDLIDKHLDLSTEKQALREVRRRLVENGRALAELDRQSLDASELEKQLTTVQEQIGDKEKALRRVAAALESKVIKTQHLWENELRYLVALVNGFDSLVKSVEQAFEEIKLSAIQVELPKEETPNRGKLLECANLARQVEEIKDKAKDDLIADINKVREIVRQKASDWKTKYEEQKSRYDEFMRNLGESDTAKLERQLRALRTKASKLRSNITRIRTALRKKAALEETRREMLDDLETIRDGIYQMRSLKVTEIREKLGEVVGFDLEKAGNRREYQQLLTEMITGTYMRKDVLERIVKAFSPRELVTVAREGHAQELATTAEISFDWSKKLIEVLRSKRDQLYELEIVHLEDLPSISLQVGDDRYRPIEKLSTGQKSTVIVLLAMVEGKNPIIFDQMEDALDTAFIYSDVVQSLRKEKELRQFILVTRNPNISVAADADLGIVLEGTADSGQIKNIGGLDDIESRDLVVLYLEGGPEAFLLRQKKYDLEKRASVG